MRFFGSTREDHPFAGAAAASLCAGACTRRHGFARIILLVALSSLVLKGWAQPAAGTVDQLLSRAMEAQQRGDFKVAIRDYRKVLALRPKEVEARVNLGAALANDGQFDEAIAQYRAALPAIPLKEPVLLNIGLAYYKKGDFKAAREQFEAVHESQPGNVKVAILLGDAETRLGQGAAAVALLSPLEARNADNLDLEYRLGLALIESGARMEGVSRIEQVAKAGNSAEAYEAAGSTLLKMNEYERARRDLDAAMQLEPARPGLATLAGTARDKTGDVPSAEAAFRSALKLKPDDFEANLYLGAILYKRRELDEARPYLDRAVKLDPKSSMAIYESAMLKGISGEPESAARDLEKLAQSDPDWLEPHVALATLYYKLHRPEDGAKQRAIVDKLTAAQQAQGPGKP